jgi:hypothetical protein
LEAGLVLSEALEWHPTVFSRLHVEMVGAGEAGGILDEVLFRIAEQLEKEADLRRKVKSAKTYPIIVLALVTLAALFMLSFIVPTFARMFEELGPTLPLPTRIVMGISDSLTSIFWVFAYAGMGRRRLPLSPVETDRAGQKGLGTCLARDSNQDRRVSAEGSPRPLRPHSRHLERRRRSDPAGPGDNG